MTTTPTKVKPKDARNPKLTGRYRVQVFNLNSYRHITHHSDGTYDNAIDAIAAAGSAIMDKDVKCIMLTDMHK